MGGLFVSADAKAVSAALSKAFPEHLPSAKDVRFEDTGEKGIGIMILAGIRAASLDADEADNLARKAYEQAQELTARPVRVSVQSFGNGVESYCDRDLYPLLIMKETQAILDSVDYARPGTSISPPDSSSPEPLQATDTTTQLLDAVVRFADDNTAAVTFRTDASADAQETLKNLIRVVPYYFAKVLYDLGDSDAAVGLVDYMRTAGQQMMLEADKTAHQPSPDDRDQLAQLSVLPGSARLVEELDRVARIEYTITLVRGAGEGGLYATLLDYTPEGGEGYYAPMSVVFLASKIVSTPLQWWVAAAMGSSLVRMAEVYAGGAEEWDTIQNLVEVPSRIVEGVIEGWRL